jgi:hypothetical protein
VKVYLAILNSGWIRREIVYTILPQMLNTKGVEVVFENPHLSWGHPISSNRNAITKRFLATDCDFLLMIDDDIVPLHNPIEMVFADKDIIGCPAKVRQANRACNWNLYQWIGDGYMPVDLRRAPSDGDVVQVDIVGSGCVLVKRKVLQSIKAAWNCEYDEDGVSTYGTDFAFCRRAKENGFEVWTTPWRWCEHIKDNVGLSDFSGYDHMDNINTDNAKWELPWGGMAIQSIDWDYIKPLVIGKKVLEFGAGLSSLLIGDVAEKLDSYETEQSEIDRISKLNPNLCIHKWDGNSEISEGHYDVAFVDGPAGGVNRERAYRIAAKQADAIIVHDAGRTFEQKWQREILASEFRCVSWNASHQQRCALWVRK